MGYGIKDWFSYISEEHRRRLIVSLYPNKTYEEVIFIISQALCCLAIIHKPADQRHSEKYSIKAIKDWSLDINYKRCDSFS